MSGAEVLVVVSAARSIPLSYVDRELSDAGAVVRNRFPPFIPRVVRDRELLTGQDPFAAAKLGQQLVGAIAGR